MATTLSPAQRSLLASAAALTRWSRINSPGARRQATAAAQRGRVTAWEKQADPDGVLSDAERAAAVDRLKRAHYKRMAAASAASRRRGAA